MIFASEYDPNCEPEPACDAHDCNDLLEQDLLGDWFCPSCLKREQEKAEKETEK